MDMSNIAAPDGRSQRFLGSKGLVVLIAFLSAFVPLSTDLYLPALPGMAEYFHAPVTQVNLTLILFFIFYSIGMLVWGPLSDKYGRKPILLCGMVLYVLASALAAHAVSLNQLIVFRVLQAIGGSSATAVSTAIVKDVYDGRKRESVLALVQSMVMIAPAVAPLLGAFLLQVISWRGVFWTLAGIGLLALLLSLLLEETVAGPYQGSLWQAMAGLGKVLGNPGFTSLLLTFSLINLVSMAFVAASSYIYENQFGLTAQSFSYYFTFNAAGLIAGPMLYIYFSSRFERRSIIAACFAMIAGGGALVCWLGSLQPSLFAVLLFPATIAGSCARPPGANLMLEQQQENIGSASSLIGCFGLFMGSIGMLLISSGWDNLVLALGLLNMVIGLSGGTLWLFLSRQPFIKQVG
jgi:DHA1 family bicyclomycin/chloramphenicol resistance-like MFS transporter